MAEVFVQVRALSPNNPANEILQLHRRKTTLFNSDPGQDKSHDRQFGAGCEARLSLCVANARLKRTFASASLDEAD